MPLHLANLLLTKKSNSKNYIKMKTYKLALHGENAAKHRVKAANRQEAAAKLREMFPNFKIVAHREVREVKSAK